MSLLRIKRPAHALHYRVGGATCFLIRTVGWSQVRDEPPRAQQLTGSSEILGNEGMGCAVVHSRRCDYVPSTENAAGTGKILHYAGCE